MQDFENEKSLGYLPAGHFAADEDEVGEEGDGEHAGKPVELADAAAAEFQERMADEA